MFVPSFVSFQACQAPPEKAKVLEKNNQAKKTKVVCIISAIGPNYKFIV